MYMATEAQCKNRDILVPQDPKEIIILQISVRELLPVEDGREDARSRHSAVMPLMDKLVPQKLIHHSAHVPHLKTNTTVAPQTTIPALGNGPDTTIPPPSSSLQIPQYQRLHQPPKHQTNTTPQNQHSTVAPQKTTIPALGNGPDTTIPPPSSSLPNTSIPTPSTSTPSLKTNTPHLKTNTPQYPPKPQYQHSATAQIPRYHLPPTHPRRPHSPTAEEMTHD
nr:mucin-7-like [Penaeus vannamei]